MYNSDNNNILYIINNDNNNNSNNNNNNSNNKIVIITIIIKTVLEMGNDHRSFNYNLSSCEYLPEKHFRPQRDSNP